MKPGWLVVSILLGTFCCTNADDSDSDPVWSYQCVNDRCIKTAISEESNPLSKAISLPACRLFCGPGTGLLWPQPTGPIEVGNELAHIDPEQIWFEWDENLRQLTPLWEANKERFRKQLHKKWQDEVSIRCWNATHSITSWMNQKNWGLQEADFMKLWNYFQTEALRRLDNTLPADGKKRPIVMWTSKLTESPYLEQYLDKDRYLIQVWTTGNDSKVANLLEKGYRLIISNYDALYLDCGSAGWVTVESNWCAPYIGWRKVYNNDLLVIGGPYAQQILGGEAALWTEQSDSYTLDNRLWPRLSAHAERLWSNPRTGWQAAEARMLVHRERLVEEGIAANSLQPRWCLQNEGNCPIGGDGGRS
uniref:beta-N-acetylhexosaminidase n=1 Tax=Anopheles atroparvus TaxID=41427 RepID=A0A182J6L7_ANOAO